MKFLKELLAFKGMKLKRKMFVAYAWCVIVPLLFLSINHCLSIVRNVNRNSMKDIAAETTDVCDGIENILNNALLISDAIYYDDALYTCLNMRDGSIQDFIDNARSIDEVSAYQTLYDFVESVEIYSDNNQLYKSQVLRHSSDLNAKAEWYKIFRQKKEELQYITYYDSVTKKSVISIVRLLNYDKKVQDILKVNISYQSIARLLRYDAEKGWMCFLDDKNRCIAFSDNSEPEGELYSPIEMKRQSHVKPLETLRGYKVYCEYTNQRVEEITWETVRFLFVMLGIMILALYVGYRIIYGILCRIDQLDGVTLKMQQGKFEKVDETGLDDDEIASLTRGFNAAVDKINTLINEVYLERISSIEKENEKRTAEFIALQNQVNPHFIFNILESLHMKLFMRGDTEAAQIIQSMAVTFRKLLDWKSDTITVRDEMSFIHAFMDVSCFNMEKEIARTIHVEKELLDCRIPKMAWQVFVENAFRHGLENVPKDHSCMFSLMVAASGDRMMVTIADNGCGMDEELVCAINQKEMEYIKKRGVGIFNALMRLGLLFENDFEIYVTSTPYQETKITMNLPIKFDE